MGSVLLNRGCKGSIICTEEGTSSISMASCFVCGNACIAYVHDRIIIVRKLVGSRAIQILISVLSIWTGHWRYSFGFYRAAGASRKGRGVLVYLPFTAAGPDEQHGPGARVDAVEVPGPHPPQRSWRLSRSRRRPRSLLLSPIQRPTMTVDVGRLS